MNAEMELSNDTIEELKKILGSIEAVEYNTDIFSLCIRKTLKNEINKKTL